MNRSEQLLRMRSIPLMTIICLLGMTYAGAADSLVTGGPYTIGDLIQISGDTNYNTENRVLVEVFPASFGPAAKYEPSMSGGFSTVVPVMKTDTGGFAWSANMSTTGWEPDQYMVRVEVIGKGFRESSIIILTEKSPIKETESHSNGSIIDAEKKTSVSDSVQEPGLKVENQTMKERAVTVPATPEPSKSQNPEPTRKSPMSPIIIVGALIICSIAAIGKK